MSRGISMDKKWDEESYARTLAEASSIRSDKKKMKMAEAGAKRMAKEKMDEAKAMQKIAKKPQSTRKSSSKSSSIYDLD